MLSLFFVYIFLVLISELLGCALVLTRSLSYPYSTGFQKREKLQCVLQTL